MKRTLHYAFVYINESTGTRGTDHPLFSNFLFTNLFSIKFLYFFFISSPFPYFNLFVSIFIQSYVNIKLHVSTLYRIHKACNSAGLKIVPLLASSTFIAPYFHYVIQTRTFLKDASFCPCFCFVHTIAQFSRRSFH